MYRVDNSACRNCERGNRGGGEGKTMNWKRGMLRLWVLFTLLWCVGVGWIAYFDYQPEPTSMYAISAPWGEKYKVIAPAVLSQSEVLDYVKSHAKQRPECHREHQLIEKLRAADNAGNTADASKIADAIKILRKNLERACDDPTAMEMSSQTESMGIWRYIGLAIIAPMILLVLGLFGGWIIRGFSPAN
jgi:hypothetical protein